MTLPETTNVEPSQACAYDEAGGQVLPPVVAERSPGASAVSRSKPVALLALLVVAVVVLVAAATGIPRIHGRPWYAYAWGGAGEEPASIRVSGNIELTHSDVSFKIPGRVDQRLVDEGDVIGRGQVIALLDSSELECDVQVRRAELQAAEAALAELKAGSRPEEKAAARAALEKAEAALQDLMAGSRAQEIKAAAAAKEAAKTELDRLESELARAQRLVKTGSITEEQYVQAQAAQRVAAERYRQAEEQWSLTVEGPRKQQIIQAERARDQALAQYDLVTAGPRKETIEQAQARRNQAAAALKLAETRLSYAKLVWPPPGVVLPRDSEAERFVVLSKNVEPGEYVAPGTPVVTVGDMVHVWLRAYINETDLGRVKVGQTARVTTDTYPGKVYEGKVSFLADQAEFTPKNVQTEKERVKLVYRIKIDITNPHMELKPGMPADAEISLAEDR